MRRTERAADESAGGQTARAARQRRSELDILAADTTIDEILHDYPQLVRDDVLACIAYGSEMSRERYVAIPVTKPA